MSFRWLTSLSVAGAAVLSAASVNTTDRYLPLIYDGGGWKTYVAVANPGKETAPVTVSFLRPKGYADPWAIQMQVAGGSAAGQAATASLPPGASMVIETSGAGPLKEGFAVVSVTKETAVGAVARLVHTTDGKIDQTLSIPLSPELEKRSMAPVFLDGESKTDLVLVSETRAALIELFFRDLTGKVVHSAVFDFGNNAQEILSLEKQYPALRGFMGTLEWKVSFPTADIYEDLTMAAMILTTKGGGTPSPVLPMTLPEDQARRSSH